MFPKKIRATFNVQDESLYTAFVPKYYGAAGYSACGGACLLAPSTIVHRWTPLADYKAYLPAISIMISFRRMKGSVQGAL
jgi:hypothetical protein